MGSSNTAVKDEAASDGDDSNGDPSASDPGNFSEGDKVLAYHGPRIYEAKVLKVEFRKKEWRYYVHYLGWSKNWDEWVVVDRLMKFTEENVRKQKDLDKKLSADKSLKAGRSAQIKPKGSTASSLTGDVGITWDERLEATRSSKSSAAGLSRCDLILRMQYEGLAEGKNCCWY